MDVLKRYENNRLRTAVRKIIFINQFNKIQKDSVNDKDPMIIQPMSSTIENEGIIEDIHLPNSI